MSDNETKAREIADKFGKNFIGGIKYKLQYEQDIFEAALEAINSKDSTIAELEAELARLKAENELLAKDSAFYRCCALSGEVPTDGSEPSKKPITQPEGE